MILLQTDMGNIGKTNIYEEGDTVYITQSQKPSGRNILILTEKTLCKVVYTQKYNQGNT